MAARAGAETSSARPPRTESVARSTGFALASQIGSAAFTAALTVFLARRLGAGQYGLFALALSVGALLILPVDAGVSAASARFMAERREDRGAVAGVLSSAFGLKVMISLPLCGAMFALAGPVADAYHASGLAWPLRGIAIATLGQSFLGLYTGGFVAMRRVGLQLRTYLAESAVEVGASVLIVLLGGGAAGAAFGRAAGYVFGALLAAALMARLVGVSSLRPAFRVRAGPGAGRGLIGRYAGAIFIIEAAYTLFEQMDVLLIGAYLTATAAGTFSAPLRLAAFLHYPGLAVSNAVSPRLAQGDRSGRPDPAGFLTALRLLTLLQAAMLGPLLAWAAPITRLVLGGGYAASADVLRALTPFIFLSGLAPLVSVSLNYLGEAGRRIPISIAAVAANLVIDVILIPSIGVTGGAVGSDVGYAIYVPAHLWVCARVLRLDLRPLLGTLMRALAAAGAMTGVMLAVGSSARLGVEQWLGGAVGGALAFAAALMLLREFSPSQVRAAVAALRARVDARRVSRRRGASGDGGESAP